jgi:hypothetical protein
MLVRNLAATRYDYMKTRKSPVIDITLEIRIEAQEAT